MRDTTAVPAAVVVPVKAFAAAKLRLAAALSGPERAALARRMAHLVLTAAAPLPVVVVCDDPEVATWATDLGAEVLWCPERGLNGAVADGVAHLAARGHHHAVVAHADLPLATSLGWVADFGGITLVPDRTDDGTNVMALPLPAAAAFRFRYGPGSFARHHAEARHLGLAVRVVRDPALGWDVDVPADLDFDRTTLDTPCR